MLCFVYYGVYCLVLVLMCILRATVSVVSCLDVPAFICIDLLISCALKINDDDDDEMTCKLANSQYNSVLQ